VLAGDRAAGTPRQVCHAGDPHLSRDREELALEPDEYAGPGGRVLDVAPASVDRFVLIGVELANALLLGAHLVVVAQERVDLLAGVVVPFTGEAAGQVPARRKVGPDEQAVVGLIAGSL